MTLPEPRVNAVTPRVFALAIMSSAFTGQAIALGFDRRYGVLKRLAGTALPRWLLVAGRVLATLCVVLIQLVGTLVAMVWIPAAGFDSVARELEDAARDAGAGPVRVFWSITLPLAMPALIVASFLAFLAAFDEAQGTLIVGSPYIVTMPTLMYTLVVNYPEPVGAIFSILLSAPSVILLLIARRFLLAGYLAAGFKGR